MFLKIELCHYICFSIDFHFCSLKGLAIVPLFRFLVYLFVYFLVHFHLFSFILYCTVHYFVSLSLCLGPL